MLEDEDPEEADEEKAPPVSKSLEIHNFHSEHFNIDLQQMIWFLEKACIVRCNGTLPRSGSEWPFDQA